MSKIAKLASKWARSITSLLHFASYGEHPERAAVLTAFIRLHCEILLSAMSGRPLRRFSLLGRVMRFADPHIFSLLLMELFIEETYKGCDPPPATILDLGSNIGMSIVLFKSLWPTCKILGVEASPEIFAMLQQNVLGFSDVTVLNLAVSNRHGQITFYSSAASLMGSTNTRRGGSEESSVEAVPISKLITGPVDLLKIDIEGSEIAAFAELEASGKMPLIGQMFIEYHHHISGETDSLAAFLQRLDRCGFAYEVAAALPDSFGSMQDVLIRAKRVEHSRS